MSTTALVLTAAVCVGLYVALRPRKATQSEYMRGMTDAQAMVEYYGLQQALDYFEREYEPHIWEYGNYDYAWQDFLRSKQAQLADLEWQARKVTSEICKRGVA